MGNTGGRETTPNGEIEFTDRTRIAETPDLGHAARERGAVAVEVVGDELAAPTSEEASGMLTGSAFREVVDDRLQGIVRRGAVAPDVSSMGFALAGRQHRYRRLVGMEHRALQHQRSQGVPQWHCARVEGRIATPARSNVNARRTQRWSDLLRH